MVGEPEARAEIERLLQSAGDGVNVKSDVYRIRTAITEQNSKVEAGYSVQIQEPDPRKARWGQFDDVTLAVSS